MSALETTNQFLQDLIQRQGQRGGGHSTIWELERTGGKIISFSHYEPDPITFREEYYYNTTENILYKKVTTTKTPTIIAHWQRASQ